MTPPPSPPPTTSRTQYAVQCGGSFAPLAAGIVQHQPTQQQTVRTAHYFGSGRRVATPVADSTLRLFSGVWVPGDAAQTAILEAAEAGRRVQMLCWHDHLPAAHAQSRGNGYLFSALPQVESDGAFALGSGPVLRFSLSQCGGQRTGHVRRDNHGRLLFAPLAPR